MERIQKRRDSLVYLSEQRDEPVVRQTKGMVHTVRFYIITR